MKHANLNAQCFLCQMLQDGRRDGVVFENEKTLVMIDNDWVVLGQVLICWKKHIENILDLTSDEYQNFSHLNPSLNLPPTATISLSAASCEFLLEVAVATPSSKLPTFARNELCFVTKLGLEIGSSLQG